jgi:hypothetical protein
MTTKDRKETTLLLRTFKRGLLKRYAAIYKIGVASEQCAEALKQLHPYFDKYPDLKEKADKIAVEHDHHLFADVNGYAGIDPGFYETEAVWRG